jgi:hypothetical protein
MLHLRFMHLPAVIAAVIGLGVSAPVHGAEPVTTRPKYSEATIRGNIVPTHCFIDMFLLLLLRDLHSFTAPREILFGENIAENDC